MVRENLVIMDAVITKFAKSNLLQITKSTATFLLLFFAGCLVATGLLVYNFSSCSNAHFEDAKVSCSKTDLPLTTEYEGVTEDITTTPPVTTTDTVTDTDTDLDVRLPKTVLPHSYKLRLVPFLKERNFTFHGEVEILVNATESTSSITLHADDLHIDWVNVTDANGNAVPVKNLTMLKRKQFLIIYLSGEIAGQNQYYIFVAFRGVLNDLLQGFYRSSYEEDGETR